MRYFLYRFGEWLALILGRRGSYWLACRIADLRFIQSPANKQVVEGNLRVVLQDQSRRDVRKQARMAFRQFAKAIADFMMFRALDRKFVSRHIHVTGLEHLKKALARGKGALIVSSHLGNWELGAAALSILGFPVYAFALPHTEKKVDAWFNRQRRAVGVNVINARLGIRRCLELLHQNKIVALLGDKDFTGGRGVWVNFFGRRSELPKGPAAISLKTGASFVPVFNLRNGQGDYELLIKPSIEPNDTHIRQNNVVMMTQRFAQVLESIIRKHPEQWTLYQPMW